MIITSEMTDFRSFPTLTVLLLEEKSSQAGTKLLLHKAGFKWPNLRKEPFLNLLLINCVPKKPED